MRRRIQRIDPTPGPSPEGKGREQYTAARHLITGTAAQRIGQRRFPRAVRPHDRMNLPRVDGKREALEDRLVPDGVREVIDLKHFRAFFLKFRAIHRQSVAKKSFHLTMQS